MSTLCGDECNYNIYLLTIFSISHFLLLFGLLFGCKLFDCLGGLLGSCQHYCRYHGPIQIPGDPKSLGLQKPANIGLDEARITVVRHDKLVAAAQ